MSPTANRGDCRIFDGFVLSTLFDHKGRLWIGSNSTGLYLIDQTGCHVFLVSERSPSAPIHCLFEDSRGRIWIGTNEEAIRFDGDQFQSYRLEHSPQLSIIGSFAEDPRSGTLWAGNQAGGLYRLQGDRFAPVAGAEEISSLHISSLMADKDGVLWIGTQDEGLACFRRGHVVRISE